MADLERKRALKTELGARLGAALGAARAAHDAAIEGATHEQARAENDKDTRGLEQSYLARGQAARIALLEASVAAVQALELRRFGADEAVAIGALVEVADEGGRRAYLVIEHGGGEALASGAVQVVSPAAPLGRALVGKRVGEVAELRLAGRTRELEILAIE